MPLTGTLVNFAAIIIGGAVGLLFRKGLPPKYMNAVLGVIGLVVVALGIKYVFDSQQILVVIISVIVGTIVGTALHLDERLRTLGDYLQSHIRIGGDRFSEGFTTATLLYCIGAMAITGAIQGGLQNDHSILYLKAVMDGVTAVFFASTLGIGVLFSAIPVLIYQGAIALGAAQLAPVLNMAIVPEMSAAGGIALMALGLGLADIKKLKVADILPSIFFPILIYPLIQALTGLFA